MGDEGSYSETAGILIIVGACFVTGSFVSGSLNLILYSAGVAVLILWVVRYILEGAANPNQG
jgi:hypothetical protein